MLYTSIRRRLKAILRRTFLYGFSLAFAASLTFPLITYATTASSMSYVNKIRSFQFYYAMADCVNNAELNNDISNGNREEAGAAIASGNWYRNDTAIVGYVADTESSPDGRMECNNIVRQAINLWGYGQFTSAFKAMGFKENGNGTWSKNSSPRNAMLSSVRGLVYANNDPVAPNGATYYQLLKALSGACEASEVATGSLTADQRAKGYVQVYIVDEASSPRKSVPKVYDISNKKNDSVAVGEVRNAGSDRSMECATIASILNQATADEYVGYLNSLPPGAATPDSPTSSGNTDDDASSCSIPNIGWIVCPVMSFMAEIVDGSYTVVADLLKVQPLYTTTQTDESKALYTAWTVMRNIANIAFVIAFMIIIYAQITGMGVSNYGIKRMLPRIVIAAVLVNVSFWICAAAVDLSNIVGSGAKSILEGPFDSADLFTSENLSTLATGEGWVGIVGGTLAGGAAVGIALYATLSALLPALVAALFAIVTVFLVLTLRQALIILLVVVAPLAFVAFLLPNTEDWFKKWRSLFQTLLLMYPIIAFIFGASALASQIVMASAKDNIPVAIAGALISVIPLAITPIVMKSAGGLLNRFGAVVNNPNKGPFDRLRKGAEGYRDKRQDIANTRRLKGTSSFGNMGGKWRNSDSRFKRTVGYVAGAGVLGAGGLAGRKLTKEEQAKSAKGANKYAQEKYVAKRAADENSGYAEKIAGPTGDARLARAYAVQTLEEEEAKDIKAASATISKLSNDKVATLAGTGMTLDGSRELDGAELAASLYRIMETGSFKERQEGMEFLAENKSKLSADVRNQVVQRSIKRGDNNIWGPDFGNQIVKEDGSITDAASLRQAAATNAANGRLSAEHVVQNAGSTKYIIDSAQGNGQALANIKAAADTARNLQSTASKVTNEFDAQFIRVNSTGTASQENGEVIIQTRNAPTTNTAQSTPTQEQRDQGGNFNGFN